MRCESASSRPGASVIGRGEADVVESVQETPPGVLVELEVGVGPGGQDTVVGCITREMTTGGKATAVSRKALVLLDEIEELLSERVLTYAARER